MRTIEVSEKSISNMRFRLSLDYICWIATTIALWWFEYPTIAALVGATGIMYLWKMTGRYREAKREIISLFSYLAFLEQMELMQQELGAKMHVFDNEQDLAEFIASFQEDDDPPGPDDWPNP